MNNITGKYLHVNGVVQGVGFRPFIYNLATKQNLTGWVRNTSSGVEIHIEGDSTNVENFLRAIKSEHPPLAKIDELIIENKNLERFQSFEIIPSEIISDASQPIAPDVCICQDCLNELFDPNDRRYLYPFINCTNCGPRFTIIKDIPYDRPKTTMATFNMCADCSSEYQDPLNRRFHAQPVACPACGPIVWLENKTSQSIKEIKKTSSSVIYDVQRLLLDGKIVAIKGLGGFHLACDAQNKKAVDELRNRKLRVDKPFAIMMADIQSVSKHCFLNEHEKQLLLSPERPIILLKRKPDSTIAYSVAPGQDKLGVMLPYTPLHYLLFHDYSGRNIYSNHDHQISVLVMTSGNLSEEPIVISNNAARKHLSVLADAFLMHDRPIYIRCDDSVICSFEHNHSNIYKPSYTHNSNQTINSSQDTLIQEKQTTFYPIRRSRGYAPYPVQLYWDQPPTLAVGGELKNTFCITRKNYAFLSQHIGDLENYETLTSFQENIVHYEQLFRTKPEIIAYDLHPNYLSTRYALERADNDNIPAIGIQHHHAHIVACMVDNQIENDYKVIGVAFDGTGYGIDGAIWGGEFLISTFNSFERISHLKYVPLPGGDVAIRKPARNALAHLWNANLAWEEDIPSVKYLEIKERQAIKSQLVNNFNSQPSSSIGRLFDAVASLSGVCHNINYEAQAAIELETICDHKIKEQYIFSLSTTADGIEIDPAPVIKSIVDDVQTAVPKSIISARFHNALSQMVLDVCTIIRNYHSCNVVVLSGGVWQNLTLLRKTLDLLHQNNFITYIHRCVPTNDGGIALGQAAIASKIVQK